MKKMVQNLTQVISKNSPTLLTGLGVAGLVTTTVLAVKATPKALQILEERKEEELEINEDFKCFTRYGVIKEVWKCYIPAAIMGGVTIACMIGANSISLKRNAALAGVYSLTERTLREYQSKVVETLGEKKAKDIKDEVYKDRLKKNPVDESEVIMSGKGETLCYDAISGRYFKSDIETIRRVQNDLNRDLIHEMWLTLNDVYYALGLPPVKMGEHLGWAINESLIDIKFSSQLTEKGVPCLVVEVTDEHNSGPYYDYREK